LFTLELGNLFVKVFDLPGNVLPDFVTLLATVNPIFRILAPYLVYKFALVLLKLLINHLDQLLFALSQLLSDVIG
jgi:hypothetical protein